jgi:hypothetical protein
MEWMASEGMPAFTSKRIEKRPERMPPLMLMFQSALRKMWKIWRILNLCRKIPLRVSGKETFVDQIVFMGSEV